MNAEAVTHEGAELVAAMQAGFVTAAERSGMFRERYLALAGEESLWRFAGDELAVRLLEPMKHLTLDSSRALGTGPDSGLVVEIWDEEETGVGLPIAQPAEGQSYLAAGRLAMHSEPGAVTIFDRARRRVWGWRRDRGGGAQEEWRALPGILPLILVDRGISMVHCGLVGSEAMGVLIAGVGGSGKSTTAVACARAGLRFAADDFAAVAWPAARDVEARSGIWMGHSLSSCARVDPAALEAFPGLVPAGAGHLADEKVMLDVEQLGDVSRRLPIGAVVVLNVGARRTQLSPISPARALLAFGPNSLIIFPGGGAWGMSRLAAMLRSLPCHQLDVRGDPEEAGVVIADLAHRSRLEWDRP